MIALLKTAFSSVTGFLGGFKIYLAVLAVGLALGAGGTWRVMSWEQQAQQVKTVTKTVTQIKYQDRVTEKVVTKYLQAKAAQAEETRNRIEDVPAHVTPQADAACTVPLGLIRVWDDAVHQPVPDASAGADDAPSGLACSDLAKAFVEAAGQYDAVSHQLMALQDWVRQQREIAAK